MFAIIRICDINTRFFFDGKCGFGYYKPEWTKVRNSLKRKRFDKSTIPPLAGKRRINIEEATGTCYTEETVCLSRFMQTV